MAAPIGLVGRQEELALLRSLVADGRSVVLAGDAGVGKTRLAREAIEGLAEAGTSTGWLAVTRSSLDVPFGALGPLLPPNVIAESTAASIARVLQAAREQQSGGPPLLPDVLVIDDAHLADDSSAALVHQLVTTAGLRVVLVLTTGHTPADAVTALWKDGAADRIELQPLARSEGDALVTELAGSACSALMLERVWERTQGNPLFVRELLHAARAGGWLVPRGDRLDLADGAPLNGPLLDLVKARVDRLSRPTRRVLELIALAAPLPLGQLEQLADVEAIAEAEEEGFVDIVTDRDRVVARATHPMHDEVVRVLMPAARKRALCHELANTIEATGLRRREDVVRFLTWRLDAGETAPVDRLLQGTWQSTDALDMRLGERLGRAAVAAAPHDHRARLALADALYRQTRFAEAIDVLAESDAATDREITEITVARAKALWGLGRAEEAEASVIAARATITDRACLGWLQSFRATVRTALGFAAEAVALSEPIAADPTYGPRAMLSCMSSLSLALAFCGRSSEAVAAVRRGSDPELLAHAESRTLLSWIEPALWVSYWLAGDVREADALADVYRESGLRTNDPERVAAGSMGTGWAAVLRGDLDTAATRFEEAAAVVPAHDRIGIKTLALIGLGLTNAWRGDATAAGVALAAADDASHPGTRWFDPLKTVGRGWVAATAGDERGAQRVLASAADDAEERGLLPYALHALHSMARLGRSTAVLERLETLCRRVDGPLAPLVIAHVGALAANDPGALDACSAAFGEADMLLLSAESAAMAAARHAEVGDRLASEAARVRAETLLASCGGARPITLQALFSSAPLLTAREREVAQLAARGRTTREIADQLFLSMRTIDSHLAHVYTKLGVDGRHELAAALASGTQLATKT